MSREAENLQTGRQALSTVGTIPWEGMRAHFAVFFGFRSAAPEQVRAKFGDILRLEPILLDPTDEVINLSEVYSGHGALPPKFRNDLLHIALATVANVDVLVSWNFKHIVRLEKIRIFNAVNLELGYKPLQIHSPQEVASYE